MGEDQRSAFPTSALSTRSFLSQGASVRRIARVAPYLAAAFVIAASGVLARAQFHPTIHPRIQVSGNSFTNEKHLSRIPDQQIVPL